jgi:acetyltransferase-like isoleucine patch superfamily enzyme
METKVLQAGIRDVQFGEGCTVVAPLNLYGCTLGDHVFVGPFTEIQEGVTIGAGCRIQSHSFICTGVRLGHHCFVGHGVMFVNDAFKTGGPAGGDRSAWGQTNIGDNVSIGSNATIMPVTICSQVVIGAGAVVTRSIAVPGVYAGNPARLLRKF